VINNDAFLFSKPKKLLLEASNVKKKIKHILKILEIFFMKKSFN